MKRIALYLISSLVVVSCSLFSSESDGELSVQLNPALVSIEENPTLVIDNMTASVIRYHCGHSVEVYKNEKWETATTTGCANSFPFEIKPKESHSIPLNLFIEEQGTYRAIIFISIKYENDWISEQCVTNSIEVIQ